MDAVATFELTVPPAVFVQTYTVLVNPKPFVISVMSGFVSTKFGLSSSGCVVCISLTSQ